MFTNDKLIIDYPTLLEVRTIPGELLYSLSKFDPHGYPIEIVRHLPTKILETRKKQQPPSPLPRTERKRPEKEDERKRKSRGG